MQIKTLFQFRQAYRKRWSYFGGYVHIFIMGDGTEMCIPCVEKQLRSLIEAFQDGGDISWRPIGYEALEGPETTIYCCQCNKILFEVEDK